jgi:hypothetical protein
MGGTDVVTAKITEETLYVAYSHFRMQWELRNGINFWNA